LSGGGVLGMFFNRSKLNTVIDTICPIMVAMKEIKVIVMTSH
jgi:hypothetical protein